MKLCVSLPSIVRTGIFIRASGNTGDHPLIRANSGVIAHDAATHFNNSRHAVIQDFQNLPCQRPNASFSRWLKVVVEVK
jgi:hypothetical protein